MFFWLVKSKKFARSIDRSDRENEQSVIRATRLPTTFAIQNATLLAQMAFQFREFSCFRYFENLAHRVWGKAFFRKLALALQREF